MNSTTTPRAARKPAASATQRLPACAALSFVNGKVTRYGWEASSWFDVPDEEWTEGGMTGLKAFQELQQYIKAHGVNHKTQLETRWVLEDAFKAIASGTVEGQSKRGAAAAFIQCAAVFFTSMLAMDTGLCVASRLADQQKTVDFMRAKKLQDRASFIERMAAARAAKRAAREAVSIAARTQVHEVAS